MHAIGTVSEELVVSPLQALTEHLLVCECCMTLCYAGSFVHTVMEDLSRLISIQVCYMFKDKKFSIKV